MPYSKEKRDELPKSWQDKPKEMQNILIDTFNTVLYDTGNETLAFILAWKEAEKLYEEVDGVWKKKEASSKKTSSSRRGRNRADMKFKYCQEKTNKKPVIVEENEHFKVYLVKLTSEGVHNYGLKEAADIDAIPSNLPFDSLRTLRECNDHPDPWAEDYEGDGLHIPMKETIGFIDNIHVQTTERGQTVFGHDNVPRKERGLIDAIDSMTLTGNSIGYYYSPEWVDGVWVDNEGKDHQYWEKEHDIELVHNARMVEQDPACEPPYCGYELNSQSTGTDRKSNNPNNIIRDDKMTEKDKKKPEEDEEEDISEEDVEVLDEVPEDTEEDEEEKEKEIVEGSPDVVEIPDPHALPVEDSALGPEVLNMIVELRQRNADLVSENIRLNQQIDELKPDAEAHRNQLAEKRKASIDFLKESLKKIEQFNTMTDEDWNNLSCPEIRRLKSLVEAAKNKTTASVINVPKIPGANDMREVDGDQQLMVTYDQDTDEYFLGHDGIKVRDLPTE